MREKIKTDTMESMKRNVWIQRFWKKIRRPLTFLPAVCLACFIFGFSSQSGEESSSLSMQVTEILVRAADQITGAHWEEPEIQEKTEQYNIYMRKAAHMTEYALFAVALYIPLGGCGLRGRRRILMTLLISAAFAAGDEWHQSFVGGRMPSPRDVGIDCAGAGIGTCAAWIFRRKQK